MSDTKKLHRKRLSDLNNVILPLFQSKEALQATLLTTTDPLLIDSLEQQILSIRNKIVKTVIEAVPDFLESIAYSWNNSFSFDDAHSFILENLLQATDRYVTTKVPFCRFTSFFWMYNKNLLRNMLKKTKAAKRDRRKTQSLDALITPRDGDDTPRYDMFPVVDNAPQEYADATLLRSLYNSATPKQKRILKRLYLGYSQSDIARVLGVTGTNINTVIRHMRKDLERLM